MKNPAPLLPLATLCLSPLSLFAESTGSPFYGDAPDETHPWAVHDWNRPQPPLVTPGTPSTKSEAGKPPSDAVVLFDGKDLSGWEADKSPAEPTKWIVKDGAMECVPGSGYIRTKAQFADCQLHVEWAAPANVQGESQGRGNSGVFVMGAFEVQVLDNFNNPTYSDGFAASVYGIMPPLANALRPPGEFQVYDIVFRRPVYKDGKEIDHGYVTVFCNGVLVQDHTKLEGGGGHMRRSKSGPFPEQGPLKLQDHGNPVRYRNIWYRPLPPRISEGNTDGQLSPEATMAKRKEIAASIRADAAKKADPNNTRPEMMRLLESLAYESDAAAMEKASKMAAEYTAAILKTPAAQMESKKGEVMQTKQAFDYLVRFNALPGDFAPKAALDKLVREQEWDKK